MIKSEQLLFVEFINLHLFFGSRNTFHVKKSYEMKIIFVLIKRHKKSKYECR